MDKRRLLNLVIEFLQKEETLLIAAALSAREAATESEAKPENEYDTRGLEQSYLAAGQSRRVEALQMGIKTFGALLLHAFDASTPIDISAVVKMEDEEGRIKTYFLLPSYGGIKIKNEDEEVWTISPESPLGESLLGKTVGNEITVKVGDQLRSYSILSVA